MTEVVIDLSVDDDAGDIGTIINEHGKRKRDQTSFKTSLASTKKKTTTTTTTKTWLTEANIDELYQWGYTVVPNVLSEPDCDRLVREIWETIEKVSRGKTTHDNPSSWLPSSHGVILVPSELSHCKPVWEIRKATGPVFAEIWGTGDLVSSTDRINVMPVSKPSARTGNGWLHCDQSPSREGLLCVQGFVDLLGTGEHDGGLIVAKGSHRNHVSLLKDLFEVTTKDNWVPLSQEQQEHVRRVYETKKVTCARGSLVLWDSRLLHENVPPVPQLGHERMVVYTCMAPKRWSSKTGSVMLVNVEKKRKSYLEKRITTHWPGDTKLMAKTVMPFYYKAGMKPSEGFTYDCTDNVIKQPKWEEDGVVASLMCFDNANPAFPMPVGGGGIPKIRGIGKLENYLVK